MFEGKLIIAVLLMAWGILNLIWGAKEAFKNNYSQLNTGLLFLIMGILVLK